jgi:hypothetical protein
MFREALAAFGDNVKGIRGNWHGGGDIADNFNSYAKNIQAGMTEEQAALNTFTGKMAQRAGFSQVEVTPQTTSDAVEVVFTRPSEPSE